MWGGRTTDPAWVLGDEGIEPFSTILLDTVQSKVSTRSYQVSYVAMEW